MHVRCRYGKAEGHVARRDWDLSGGWGSAKKDLGEVTILRRVGGRPVVKFKLRLRYTAGMPVDKVDVELFKGSLYRPCRTDSEGRVEFVWPPSLMVDRLPVQQITVKRDWDLSGGWGEPKEDLGDLTIARPDENSPEDTPSGMIANEEQERGVRGQLFYADGTQVFESFRVEVEFAQLGAPRYSTDMPGCSCKSNGPFFLVTAPHMRGGRLAKMFINGNEVPPPQLSARRERLLLRCYPAWFRGRQGHTRRTNHRQGHRQRRRASSPVQNHCRGPLLKSHSVIRRDRHDL